MGAKASKGILSDQCASMQMAIKSCIPTTIHRCKAVYVSVHLSSDLQLFEDRHLWIPVNLDHHFWVRMRSTQRSESMHAFFNKFITRNGLLIHFVKQYYNCLGSREQKKRQSYATDF
ncbi:hypothetical protein Ahy_A05g022816 [Arachis hypogaea]|uniref:Protein FAR1-RELATED SEQUENCE n=1 Tax=Arachis hypogaea TaxID=3818 RepID=A0A445D1N8_ARAHY|nr:hypothetical protein Ahy_A05g022816 [Arachis hypogaea]